MYLCLIEEPVKRLKWHLKHPHKPHKHTSIILDTFIFFFQNIKHEKGSAPISL